MKTFYPAIEPYRTATLQVSALHTVFYEEVGNPAGLPVIFLHGGPGAGIVPMYRRIFDPTKFRVVLLDQRGAGRSTPRGELRENTTWDLVEDLEKLRRHLGIDKWLVVGGSWGGTLALLYAQEHPQSVSGLIVRGTWLARQQDLDWDFAPTGSAQMFPAEYHAFRQLCPDGDRSTLVERYYQTMMAGGEDAKNAAAAWAAWESNRISLHPEVDLAGMDMAEAAGDYLELARFEISYTYHRCWLKTDNQIVENMARITHIPGVILCGRYDVLTPVEGSYQLAQHWPAARLEIVPATGHAFFEKRIVDAHIRATESFVP